MRAVYNFPQAIVSLNYYPSYFAQIFPGQQSVSQKINLEHLNYLGFTPLFLL